MSANGSRWAPQFQGRRRVRVSDLIETGLLRPGQTDRRQGTAGPGAAVGQVRHVDADLVDPADVAKPRHFPAMLRGYAR